MKNIFIVVLWILAFSLIVCYMAIRKKKSEVKKLTQVLLLATALTEIVFSVTFFNSRPLVTDLAFGLYLACVDWLLYILMMYTEQYTKVFNEIKYVRFGMMIFCMIDTVSMIANSYLHHSFTLHPVKFLNQSYYVIGEKTPFFIVHVAFVDMWIFAILLGYIFKTMRVASMYKCKYYPVMILTITIIIASAYFEFSSIPVDFSVIVYALAALALCWFSMYVIPQDLVYNAFSFVINDYNDGIMCFDNEDQCIYINDIMSGYLCVREEEKELIHQNFQEWKKEHLENLISFARGIKGIGVKYMDFKVFDTTKIDEYSKRAKEQWGQTSEYKEFEEKTKNWTKDDEATVANEFMQLFVEFGQMKEMDPEDEQVQLQVRKLQDYITDHFYTCSDKILCGLGRMYAGGGELTENIDDVGGVGTAEFASKAIDIFYMSRR